MGRQRHKVCIVQLSTLSILTRTSSVSVFCVWCICLNDDCIADMHWRHINVFFCVKNCVSHFQYAKCSEWGTPNVWCHMGIFLKLQRKRGVDMVGNFPKFQVHRVVIFFRSSLGVPKNQTLNTRIDVC